MMNLSKFGICFVRQLLTKDDEPARFCNCFVRQLLTKQVTYQQKLQSFSFFVGALRIYHLFRYQ